MCFQLCSVTSLLYVPFFVSRKSLAGWEWNSEALCSTLKSYVAYHHMQNICSPLRPLARPCIFDASISCSQNPISSEDVIERTVFSNKSLYISIYQWNQFKHDKQGHLLRIPFPISSVSDGYSEMEISPKSNAWLGMLTAQSLTNSPWQSRMIRWIRSTT